MNTNTKLGIILVFILLITIPVMAANDNGNFPNGNDKGNNTGINIDIDNVNTNVNTNNVNVNQGQTQRQNQQQIQIQVQDQKQSQSQDNTQIVNVNLPAGNDGGLLISTSNQLPKLSTLDIGEPQEYSRLVYPGEVLQFDVRWGNIISLKSSSDVALYTIGTYPGDDMRMNSIDSIPVYDPVYHRFEFGTVVPIDKINYWTMKATLTASKNARHVVVDNRAPRNSYTHVELTIR